MPPKLPEEYSDFRKDQILNAAWDCFVEKGYSETTMREISKRINSSTGVIYNYFKGKDEILDAIQESSLEQYRQTFDRIDKKSTAREAIMEFLNSRLECCPVDVMKKSARGIIGLWSEAMKRQNIRNLFCSHHVLMRENLSRFIREGIEKGEIQSDLDPEAVAGFFIAILSGLEVQLALIDGFDADLYLENIKKIISGNLWLSNNAQEGGKNANPDSKRPGASPNPPDNRKDRPG